MTAEYWALEYDSHRIDPPPQPDRAQHWDDLAEAQRTFAPPPRTTISATEQGRLRAYTATVKRGCTTVEVGHCFLELNCCTDRPAHLTGLIVNLDYRQQGIGTCLLRQVIDDTRATGLTAQAERINDGPGMSSANLRRWYRRNGATVDRQGRCTWPAQTPRAAVDYSARVCWRCGHQLHRRNDQRVCPHCQP